jgi:hypothetical protein
MWTALTTASAPIARDVALSQLDARLPPGFPTRTRSDAMPPTTVPSANGASSEETAKAVSMLRRSRALAAPGRSAYAPPRRTMPIPAR